MFVRAQFRNVHQVLVHFPGIGTAADWQEEKLFQGRRGHRSTGAGPGGPGLNPAPRCGLTRCAGRSLRAKQNPFSMVDRLLRVASGISGSSCEGTVVEGSRRIAEAAFRLAAPKPAGAGPQQPDHSAMLWGALWSFETSTIPWPPQGYIVAARPDFVSIQA